MLMSYANINLVSLPVPHCPTFILFPERRSLCRLVVCEPLQVVAQHSFGLKGLAAAADVWPLSGVVELVDPQQRAGEEELPAGDAVVALLPGVFGPLVAQQRTRRDEALAAVLAAERTLPSVDPLVGSPRVVV